MCEDQSAASRRSCRRMNSRQTCNDTDPKLPIAAADAVQPLMRESLGVLCDKQWGRGRRQAAGGAHSSTFCMSSRRVGRRRRTPHLSAPAVWNEGLAVLRRAGALWALALALGAHDLARCKCAWRVPCLHQWPPPPHGHAIRTPCSHSRLPSQRLCPPLQHSSPHHHDALPPHSPRRPCGRPRG